MGMALACLASSRTWAGALELDRVRAMAEGGPAAQAEGFTKGRAVGRDVVQVAAAGRGGRIGALEPFKPGPRRGLADRGAVRRFGRGGGMSSGESVIFGAIFASWGLGFVLGGAALLGPAGALALGSAILAGGLYLLLKGAVGI